MSGSDSTQKTGPYTHYPSKKRGEALASHLPAHVILQITNSATASFYSELAGTIDEDKLEYARLLTRGTDICSKVDAARYSQAVAAEQATWKNAMSQHVALVQSEAETFIQYNCRFEYHHGNEDSGEKAGTTCGALIEVSAWKIAKAQKATELNVPLGSWDGSWKPSYRCQDCKVRMRLSRNRRNEEKSRRSRSRSRSPSDRKSSRR